MTPENTIGFDYTKTGQGAPLIFVHGWPFHMGTYRKVIPTLEQKFTCYNLNSLGMSNDGYIPSSMDMDFADHADRILAFANSMNLDKFSLLAHNTGGTFARIVAAKNPDRIHKLVLLNTEIPFHRPPYIPEYQRVLSKKRNGVFLKLLLRSKTYRHSARGYGGCFHDKSQIEGEFRSLFIDYFMQHKQRFEGMRRYLVDLDFSVIDSLGSIHQEIKCPIQFIWGANDVTFPMELGKSMAALIPTCEDFVAVENACFLPHEEAPEVVAQNAARFLS